MKSFKEYLEEAFDVIPTSSKDIEHPAVKRIFTAIQKQTKGTAGAMPDPITIEREKSNVPKKYDAEIKIHAKAWTYVDVEELKKLKDAEKIKMSKGSGSRFKKKEGGKPHPRGDDWESLITVAYNGGPKKDPDTFQNISHLWPHWEKESYALAKQFHKAVSGNMIQFGKGSGKLSKFWKKHGAGNPTPKTDMYTEKQNISLKKAGGSQGLSPGRAEAIAVLSAALAQAGDTDAGQFKKIIDTISKEFKTITMDGTIDEFKKKQGDFAKMKSKDYNTKSNIILKAEKKHKEISDMFENIMNNDRAFYDSYMKYFMFEACSGYKKFADKRPRASIMIEFNPDKGSIVSYNIGNISRGSPSEDMRKLSSNVKVYAAFKTSGQNPYSSLRGSFKKSALSKTAGTTFESFLDYTAPVTFRDVVFEALAEDDLYGQFLTEETCQLDEFRAIENAWRKVRGIKKNATSALNWVKRLMYSIFQKVNKILKKIARMGSRAFGALLSFFGLEIANVRVTAPNELADFMWK